VCALSNGDGVTSFKYYLDPKLANDCLQGLREVAMTVWSVSLARCQIVGNE